MSRRLLGLVPCAGLLVALVSPGTPLLARLIIVGLFGVTLWNAETGLLATAGLAPLGAFIAALAGVVNFRITEVILLSFIAAWLLRPEPDQGPAQEPRTKDQGPRLPHYAWTGAWFFAVLIISLAFGLNRQLLRYPDALRINLTTIALHYFGYSDPTGLSDCARLLEGFAIVAAVHGAVQAHAGPREDAAACAGAVSDGGGGNQRPARVRHRTAADSRARSDHRLPLLRACARPQRGGIALRNGAVPCAGHRHARARTPPGLLDCRGRRMRRRPVDESIAQRRSRGRPRHSVRGALGDNHRMATCETPVGDRRRAGRAARLRRGARAPDRARSDVHRIRVPPAVRNVEPARHRHASVFRHRRRPLLPRLAELSDTTARVVVRIRERAQQLPADHNRSRHHRLLPVRRLVCRRAPSGIRRPFERSARLATSRRNCGPHRVSRHVPAGTSTARA